MTQSKSVKKKKTKIGKDKKNDKKSDTEKPPLPVDRKVEAELNLREMIKQAHKIHKDYVVRSNSKNLTPISSKVSRINNEKRKFSANSSYDEGSVTRESIKKRSKTVKAENSSATEVVPAISRRRNLAEFGVAMRRFSEESHKNQSFTAGRSFAACAMRNRDMIAPKHGSGNFTVKENENKVIEGEQVECVTKTEDDNVGMAPFVSLELVDKMKCLDWEDGGCPKKRLLRQKRRTGNDYSGSNLTKTKKRKSKNKTEIKEDCVTDNNGTAETEKKRNSHAKKGNPDKCENTDSELIRIPRESPFKKKLNATTKAKSAVSSPTSVSSNFDNNLSTFSGAGDPFSSNTSHSYFSSDSDTSKIDKKFMEILKAVTQKNLNIDLDVKLWQKSFNTEESKHGINSDRNKLEELRQSELEQKLIKRINSLERKLGNTNANTENAERENKGQEKVGDSADVPNITSPVVEQLWIKESTFHGNYSGISLALNADQTRKESLEIKSCGESNKDVASDVRKICKSCESYKKDDDNRSIEYEQKGAQNFDRETSTPNPQETHRETTTKPGDEVQEEVINKSTPTSEVKSKSSNMPKEVTDTPNVDERKGPDQNESIETRSIIKRLEKAFQTLGLNLEDLDSSDEPSSAKKKQPLMKKCVSFGKDKRNWHKIQAMKRFQNAKTSSTSKKRSKDEDNSDGRNCIQYKVESNGSGDKNMDNKKLKSHNNVEDLRGECSTTKNKVNKDINCTRPNSEFQQNGNEEVTAVLLESFRAIHPKRYSEHNMPDNRIHSGITRMIVNNAHTEGMTMDLGEKRSLKHGKRMKNIHVDDLLLGRSSTKRKSEYSLSVSCSLSSMSEEDDFKRHKRKKKILSYSMESNTSNQDLREITTSGTGDATTQAVLQLLGRSIDWQICKTRPDQPLKIIDLELPNAQEMFHIEERNNELELKQIRERHKQIISEIKTSLNEIKKQHNLFNQLKTQTKKFHKDCHVKRKRIAAYLKDVEQTSYESRKGREPFCESNCKYRRALSTDSYSNRTRRKSKLRNKTSDYELDVMGLKKGEMGRRKKKLKGNPLFRSSRCESVLSITATINETTSDEISSFATEDLSADFSSTDTAESFRTVATSMKPPHHRARYIAEGGKIPQTLSLEWRETTENPAWHDESIEQIPHYFVKLVEELNRIILTKNSKLDDLIVKASGSSNNSSYSGKTKASASSNSSGLNTTKQQNNRTDEVSRATSTGYKTSSSNSSGKSGSKQHKSKSKGSKKSGRDKSADMDGEIPSKRSRTFIQADPGGGSMDSIVDREQEIVISESFPSQIQMDIDSLCPASCSHFDRQEEEFRYRKGDPSFRFRGQLLQCLDEHSRQCRRKTPEEERAYRRKMELERILRADEKTFKRPILFNRDSDGHALDFDTYYGGKEKHSGHVRHRQQSIIIDHNRGEENEESQTVLGHASRHSGVGRSKKAPHEYLKVDKKSEPSYHTGKKSHEIWKKSGRKNQYEEVPVNYFKISLNNPGSSANVSRDVDCQTDNVHDYEDIGDIWDESGSIHSIN